MLSPKPQARTSSSPSTPSSSYTPSGTPPSATKGQESPTQSSLINFVEEIRAMQPAMEERMLNRIDNNFTIETE